MHFSFILRRWLQIPSNYPLFWIIWSRLAEFCASFYTFPSIRITRLEPEKTFERYFSPSSCRTLTRWISDWSIHVHEYFEIDVSRKTNEFGRKVERKSIAWNGTTKWLPFLFRCRRPDANVRCKWLWEGKGDGRGSLTGTDHAPLFPGRHESIRRPCAQCTVHARSS